MENEISYKKDTTKEKIILFVIGVLVGAVIATASFLICVNTVGSNSDSNGAPSSQMQGGTPPAMPGSSDGSQNSQGGTPPEQQSSDSSSQSNDQ